MIYQKMKPLLLVMVAVCFALVCVGCASAQTSETESAVAEESIVDYPRLTPEQCAEEADLVVLGQLTGSSGPFMSKTDRAHPVAGEYCAWTVELNEIYYGSTEKTELTICTDASLSEYLRDEGTVVLYLKQCTINGRSFTVEVDSPYYVPVGGPSGIYYCEGDTLTSAWGDTDIDAIREIEQLRQ